MKKFRTYIAVLCTMLVAAACTNEMETETTTATDVAQLVKIGAFPAFDETAQTRAIGTQDKGKTEWEADDKVLLKIQQKNYTGNTDVDSPIYSTLTYNGTTWTADPTLNITLTDYRNTADITAYYAPNYEWSNGTLALKSGKTAGTDELLTYTATGASLADGISIDFSGAREYSRLRVAAAPDMSVTLTSADFTTNGDKTATATDGITATADSKGNAYFYGKWTANATLAVELKEDGTDFLTVSKTVAAASVAGSSYALDGLVSLTTYTAKGAGTADSPYRIYNATQLMDFNTEFGKNVPCDKHIKLMNDIDLTGKTWTPIGGSQEFKGTIDGNFHTIKGLNIKDDSNNGTGIIIVNSSEGVIQNLIIDGATISNEASNCTVGVFVGKDNYGIVKNCHVINSAITAPIAKNIGGLVSVNDGGRLIGCSVIKTTITCNEDKGFIGGLVNSVRNSGVMNGCMFCGPLNIISKDNKDWWALAAQEATANTTLISVYCWNTYTGTIITKELWGSSVSGTITNCAYVDGTTTTWTTAITDMNAAIKSSGITDYHYVYDATLSCPKMVKANK